MSADYYTTEQTAEFLGCTTHRVHRLRVRGDLPAAKRNGVGFLFSAAEVARYRAMSTGERISSGDQHKRVYRARVDSGLDAILADPRAYEPIFAAIAAV